jgi:hypothetical protein
MQVPIDGLDLECDEELSFKSFVNADLSHFDFNGKVIYASHFMHETPGANPFPPSMKNVTFIRCNLDNLVIPEGVTLIDCLNRFFQAQADGQDWFVHEDDLTPIAPFDYKVYLKKGLPIPSPDDLPEKAN